MCYTGEILFDNGDAVINPSNLVTYGFFGNIDDVCYMAINGTVINNNWHMNGATVTLPEGWYSFDVRFGEGGGGAGATGAGTFGFGIQTGWNGYAVVPGDGNYLDYGRADNTVLSEPIFSAGLNGNAITVDPGAELDVAGFTNATNVTVNGQLTVSAQATGNSLVIGSTGQITFNPTGTIAGAITSIDNQGGTIRASNTGRTDLGTGTISNSLAATQNTATITVDPGAELDIGSANSQHTVNVNGTLKIAGTLDIASGNSVNVGASGVLGGTAGGVAPGGTVNDNVGATLSMTPGAGLNLAALNVPLGQTVTFTGQTGVITNVAAAGTLHAVSGVTNLAGSTITGAVGDGYLYEGRLGTVSDWTTPNPRAVLLDQGGQTVPATFVLHPTPNGDVATGVRAGRILDGAWDNNSPQVNAQDTTWVYTGWILFSDAGLVVDPTKTATYAFRANFDDNAMMTIDGTQVGGVGWNWVSQVTEAEGWHEIEVRLSNGGGPGGALDGFGINTGYLGLAFGTNNAGDYVALDTTTPGIGDILARRSRRAARCWSMHRPPSRWAISRASAPSRWTAF